MSEGFEDGSEIESQLEAIRKKASDMIDVARYRTSFELFSELRMRAKREQRVHFYIIAVFHMMDEAQYLLDFPTMRERAIELISLLESEERCRAIQPNMPVQLYESLVYQLSSCAYENLAEATGQLEGYNSEGLQACIADGLHICRQTGKLGCIGCFREYSCDVYMAADDAELATHQCSLVLDESNPISDRGDRRWLAKKKLAWLAMLEGRQAEALRMAEQALELTGEPKVSLKLESRLRVHFDLDAMLLISHGRGHELDESTAAGLPERGQCPQFDLQNDMNTALGFTVAGKYPAAADILRTWDQELQEKKATHQWFEVRLRLIANSLLAGDERLSQRLAAQLQKRASTAGDWLTLRRLTALQDSDFPTSPLATFGRGPVSKPALPTTPEVDDVPANRDATDLAGSTESNVENEISDGNATAAGSAFTAEDGKAATGAQAPAPKTPPTPLQSTLNDLGKRLSLVQEESILADLKSIRRDIMALSSQQISDPLDACGLLHLMSYALADHEDAEAVWHWANELTAKFDHDPAALSLLGDIGNRIRFGPNALFGSTITSQRVEPLFRKALQCDDVGPRTYLRAGDHFAAENNPGEAERCYARGFRLDRSVGELAVRLADVYRNSDRPRDAMHVLDLCLRVGTDDPAVAWEAGLQAFGLERYEIMRTYFEKFVSLAGPQPWVSYYNAIGYADQGELDKALEAIEQETALIGEMAFHICLVKGRVLFGLGDNKAAEELYQQALKTPLYEVENLTVSGLAGLLEHARRSLPKSGSELQQRFLRRLLESGLAAEEVFEEASEGVATQNVNFYRCLVEQPLDDAWNTFPSRLPHQTDWQAYFAEWGVLAASEEEAEELVLGWQNQCYTLPAEIQSTELSGEGFTDSPGVVWQGMRVNSDEMHENPDFGF